MKIVLLIAIMTSLQQINDSHKISLPISEPDLKITSFLLYCSKSTSTVNFYIHVIPWNKSEELALSINLFFKLRTEYQFIHLTWSVPATRRSVVILIVEDLSYME